MIAWYRLDSIPVKRRVKFLKSGRTYTDYKTIADLDMVRDSYKGELFDCPVALHVVAYKQLPKRKKHFEPFTTKPDIDNIIKCVMDGLNGAAYNDDKQVVLVIGEKLSRYPSGGEFAMYRICPIDQFLQEFKLCES